MLRSFQAGFATQLFIGSHLFQLFNLGSFHRGGGNGGQRLQRGFHGLRVGGIGFQALNGAAQGGHTGVGITAKLHQRGIKRGRIAGIHQCCFANGAQAGNFLFRCSSIRGGLTTSRRRGRRRRNTILAGLCLAGIRQGLYVQLLFIDQLLVISQALFQGFLVRAIRRVLNLEVQGFANHEGRFRSHRFFFRGNAADFQGVQRFGCGCKLGIPGSHQLLIKRLATSLFFGVNSKRARRNDRRSRNRATNRYASAIQGGLDRRLRGRRNKGRANVAEQRIQVVVTSHFFQQFGHFFFQVFFHFVGGLTFNFIGDSLG